MTSQVAGHVGGRRQHIPTPCPLRRGRRTHVSFDLFCWPAWLAIDVSLCFGISKNRIDIVRNCQKIEKNWYLIKNTESSQRYKSQINPGFGIKIFQHLIDFSSSKFRAQILGRQVASNLQISSWTATTRIIRVGGHSTACMLFLFLTNSVKAMKGYKL